MQHNKAEQCRAHGARLAWFYKWKAVSPCPVTADVGCENMTTDDHFMWGKKLVACVRELRDAGELAGPFVDWEAMPHFDGRPDDMFLWFICATREEKDSFRSHALAQATASMRDRMAAAGFPNDAVQSLSTDVTSLEDIEAGGGRFLFFR